jgi:hypothetical protein
VDSSDRQASSGVGEAAQWLFTEIYPHLRRLIAEGYEVELLGHSVGGAIAALTGVLLRGEGITRGMRCFAFGAPACMNEALARDCEAFTTTLILHDDVIPRITPHAIRALLQELKQEKDSAKALWRSDLDAVIVRARGLWTPRWRHADDIRSAPRRPPAGRRGALREGGAGQEGEREDAGWDSCDDDDVPEYWGIGCTRAPPVQERVANPDSYRMQVGHSHNILMFPRSDNRSPVVCDTEQTADGEVITVDMRAARLRLLGGSTSYDRPGVGGAGGAGSGMSASPPRPLDSVEEAKSPRDDDDVAGEEGFAGMIGGRADSVDGEEEAGADDDGLGGMFPFFGQEEEGEDASSVTRPEPAEVASAGVSSGKGSPGGYETDEDEELPAAAEVRRACP